MSCRSCPNTCASTRCDPLPGHSSGGSGPSPGVLAGAVIGSLLFLALVVAGYIYYRRREVAKEAAAREKADADVKPDIPARADAVLSRPDPHSGKRVSNQSSSEKATHPAASADALGTVRVYNNQSNTTIDLDPTHASGRQSSTKSVRSNPFTDGASIQTASDRTQSTNVIPIALVTPGGHPPEPLSNPRAGTPSRPVRSPELTLNDANLLDLDHVAVSDSELDGPRSQNASSPHSDVSVNSFMTTSSAGTDLDESPTIMTPKQGVVRQVFGVSQAQVVRVPSNQSSSSARQRAAARTNSGSRGVAARASKGTVGRSPLAQQSFTPADIPLTTREPTTPTTPTGNRNDPFSDPVSPYRASFADSSRSTDTFGSPTTDYHTEGPFTPRPGVTFADAQSSRPVSTASTVDGGSIRADIGTASRVILGMQSPAAYTPSTLSPYFQASRATSMQTDGGRTVASIDRDDDEESVRPQSILSAKTTSSRADSVLAAFPFVPPSPISALPPRSPGATSPNGSPASSGSMFARQQVLNNPAGTSPSNSSTQTVRSQQDHPPPPPPPPVPRPNYNGPPTDRAESTFSTSTASGLETYPFQFASPPTPSPSTPSIQSRQSSRASLDTLALSRVLAAFPIEHEGSS
jgi:protein OPY2